MHQKQFKRVSKVSNSTQVPEDAPEASKIQVGMSPDPLDATYVKKVSTQIYSLYIPLTVLSILLAPFDLDEGLISCK